MAELGISLSFSWPTVSNDNAFAESIFRTLKFHSCPCGRIINMSSISEWVDQFIGWYNTEHRHSGIKYVKSNQCHFGLAVEICEVRKSTY